MSEIDKLRARLKNVGKNSVEYKMSVLEAQTLLNEIDELRATAAAAPVATAPHQPNAPHNVIWDGGMF